MDQTGLRQNLLSHHLTILTEAGLVQAQQSIGDARRHYYRVNLPITRGFKAWWERHSPPESGTLPALRCPRRVLFLCWRNTSRSMIAELVARHLAPQALIPYSAGIETGGTIPDVTWLVLADHHIPADQFQVQTYDAVLGESFDHLITVCDIVHENSIPPELAQVDYIHWSLRDPTDGTDDQAEQYRAAQALVEEIKLRLTFFVHRLAADEATDEATSAASS
jgi:protein-tyrosine-phosphatase